MRAGKRVLMPVKGSGGKQSRYVKVGDTVCIVEGLKKGKVEDVARFPPPRILQIGRANGKVKCKVQFQMTDRTTRVQWFPFAALLATMELFLIGDNVEVTENLAPVVVPVGTQGVVVGGDGETYHVTFSFDHTSGVVTVSQDHVPALALKPCKTTKLDIVNISDDSSDGEEAKDGEGAKYEEGAKDEEEAEDAKDEVEEPLEEQSSESDEDEEESCKALQDVMPNDLFCSLAAQLKPDALQLFAAWLHLKGVENVQQCLELQGLLNQFLRGVQTTSMFDTATELSDATVVALRQVGATDNDIQELAKDGIFHQLTPECAVKTFMNKRL